MSEKNTAELVRLIQAHLSDKSIGPEALTRDWPARDKRSYYNWTQKGMVPRNESRGLLEDALGWKRGSVTEVLESPITRTFTLSELRDWEKVDEPRVTKASELSTDELLIELTRRVGALQTEVTVLREGAAPQDIYRLAANRIGEGRNMEHLEANE